MIALLGGTFNPPHLGHIRAGLAAIEPLGIHKLGLMPCKLPPHKQAIETKPEHRLAMLQLTAQDEPKVFIEPIELSLSAPSYTINTLRHLRRQHAKTPLFFLLGEDSLYNLESWYEWRSLTDYCHLVVMKRQAKQPLLSSTLSAWLKERTCDDMLAFQQAPSGCIFQTQSPYYTVSSTQLRKALAQPHLDTQNALDTWLTPSVRAYIEHNHLYTAR